MRNVLMIVVVFGLVSVRGYSVEPAPIKVVKTWKDLHDVSPIHLGGGVKVRLGLQANKVAQWSGALLYCLTEGYTPASSGSGPSLGPVLATYHFGDAVKALKEGGKWGRGKKDWREGCYLFALAVPADRVGTCHITVTDRQKKVIAKGTIEATRKVAHPWMPWFYIRQVDDLAKNSPAKGIALPTVDHIGPIAFREKGYVKTGRLPTLLPTKTTRKMTIKMDGDRVIIRSKKGLHAKYPEFYFLVRWWVNDKPFVPQQTDRFWQSGRKGILVYKKRLPIPLAFEPELIGAKPGDKVGLQILYCETEWDWCRTGMRGHFGGPKRENLRISNRIDFVVKTKKTE